MPDDPLAAPAAAARQPLPALPETAAAEQRPRLFLIDGYSNIFRAFYAIRNLSNSKGEPTNAVYGFVTMLRKLLREERPELIGVALDVGKTFRSERFEEYKANRAPMPEDLASQMPWIRRVLEAFRIPALELSGYEADDVLGSLACRAAAAGYDVVLVSADKDLMQLVEPHVALYHTGRAKLYGPAEVAEDFGVPPAKVADVLALMGDSIDNIPGVPGIGDKGAKALIQEFGSLEELLARAAEVPRKSYREGLQQHADQARLSKELSTIHTDLPLAFDPAALRLDPPDPAALRRLFTELEFFSLLEDLAPEPAAAPAGEPGAALGAPLAVWEAESAAAWQSAAAALTAALPAASAAGAATAPAGDASAAPSAAGAELVLAVLGEPLAVGLAAAPGSGGHSHAAASGDPGGAAGGDAGGAAGGAAGPAASGAAAAAAGDGSPVLADFRRPGMREAVAETLGRWLATPGLRLVGHNLKEVLRLCAGGVPCAADLFDVMLVSYLLKPSVHGHGLDELALERLNTRPLSQKEVGWEKGEAPAPGDPRLLAFAAERVALVRGMAPAMRRELAAGLGAGGPGSDGAASSAGADGAPRSDRSDRSDRTNGADGAPGTDGADGAGPGTPGAAPAGPAGAAGADRTDGADSGARSALARIYQDIEMPLVQVLVEMEEAGILLDSGYLHAMSAELGAELVQLEEEIWRLAGERFNLNSPQQLGVVLFERLGLPVLKRTQKTRSYATGAETLEELALRGFPIAQLLLRYRELSKLKSTYVDALPSLVAADGRLHTRFQQAVAATGRLSSANPNLQNIPIRTELGQRIRRAFVAGPGMQLLAADYSQIELRILAHIAAEPELIRAFQAGEDIHRATAAIVFGIAPELVSADQRRAAKTINFGILYGMSAFGLAQNLGIGRGEADRFITAYLDRYPGVRRYVEETVRAAERDGRVETLYGRVRWLPDIQSKNRNLRENARRMAINARIQGTAADLLKVAMVAIGRRLRPEHPRARLLLTVHDELLFEVPDAEVGPVTELVRGEMEGVARLTVPLVVEAGAGCSWYDAKG